MVKPVGIVDHKEIPFDVALTQITVTSDVVLYRLLSLLVEREVIEGADVLALFRQVDVGVKIDR